MEKPELLKKVLADYCAQSDELKFQEGILNAFCDYAAEWFKKNGLIGLGHTVDGIAIRLADGSEYALFQPGSAGGSGSSVSITGGATKIEKGIGEHTPSFQITGR